jgi:hypothetical protein
MNWLRSVDRSEQVISIRQNGITVNIEKIIIRLTDGRSWDWVSDYTLSGNVLPALKWFCPLKMSIRCGSVTRSAARSSNLLNFERVKNKSNKKN